MTKFTFVGLEELKVELRKLPADLRDEANGIIRDTANSAADSVRAEYGRSRSKTRVVLTYNLRNGVKVTKQPSGPYGAAYKVASTAPHATWIEKGTEVRHYITQKNGVKKLVGRMPGYNIFGPIMARNRRFLFDELWTLLVKHGLLVRGDAA